LASDRLITAVKHIPLPAAVENTLDTAPFIAGTVIDRAPTLRWPSHNLDINTVGVVDQTPERFDR
jgi:hypothetical protein